MIDFPTGGYSAEVRLQLVVAGGRALSVAKVGPNRCILCEPTNLPPGPAELVVQVNESEQRWPVLLPRGATVESPRVEIAGA